MAKGKQAAPTSEPADEGSSKNPLLRFALGAVLLGVVLGFVGDGVLTTLASRIPVALILCIVSAVAAIAAIVYVLATREEQPLGHTLSIKLGALISVCVSGGVLCGHLLREHGVGPELSSPIASTQSAFVGVLAILPSIFVAIVVSRLFPTVLDERPVRSRLWLVGGIVGAALIHALPFVWPEFVEPAEVVESPPSKPAIKQPAKPKPPPPPAFAYEKPAGLESAPVETWIVSDQTSFDGVNQGKPMGMSPDGRLFAYCQGEWLIVRNLNADKLEAKFSGFADVEFLRWSPDSNHLFYALPEKRMRVGVVQVDRGRAIPLPMPTGDWIPDGFSSWWADEEISFAVEDAPLFLSLDNLQVRPIAQSSTQMANEVPLPTRAVSTFPTVQAGGFSSWLRFVSYHPSPKKGEEWDVRVDAAMSLKQAGRPVRRVFSECQVHVGDVVAFANDGSKFVRVRDGQADVFYFGLSKNAISMSFEIPFTDIDLEREATFTEAMETHNVMAMMAAPMVNPLNGKVVGPDRERLKGMVRFSKVDSGKASVWVSDFYEDLEEGDVVADVAMLRGEDDLGIDPYWFATIPFGEKSSVPIPTDEEAKQPDFPQFALSAIHGAILLNQPVAIETKTQSPRARAVAQEVTRAAPKPLILSDTEAKAVIGKFIKEHHEQISSGNLQGFTDHYASRVKYYSYGTISDRAILAKQREHQSKYSAFISEEVIGEITVTRNSSSNYTAQYRLDLTLRSRDGKGFELIDLVTLKIKLTTGGPKITHQDSERQSTKAL